MRRVVTTVMTLTLGLGACSSDAAPATVSSAPVVSFATVAVPSSVATAISDVAATVESGPPLSNDSPLTQPPATTLQPAPTTPLRASSVTVEELGPVAAAVDVATRTGDELLYVVSQTGSVSALSVSSGEISEVLTLSTDELASGGEQGLLGLTFSPNGKLAYINYTNADGDTEISEYEVDDKGLFNAASKRLLLTIDQPYANHNGGGIELGPDGLLYIGTGDGGAGGDPERRALNLGSLLGKMLRIDPVPDENGNGYSIPSDNPFVGVDGARPEIWAVGLRNPWRFSFDRATNDLWIADVGQNDWEEIDVAWAQDGGGAGMNFGWSAFEGTHRYNEDQSATGVTPPVYEYRHGEMGCSISGGVLYRGEAIPALKGRYVYGDYCTGQIRALALNADGTASTEVAFDAKVEGLSSINQDANGELIITSVLNGAVLALRVV